MRTVVITQPTFLPWLGGLEQIIRADCLVWLDMVQFVKRGWDNRNRLKGPDGNPFWLTVPVVKAPQDTLLKDVIINSRSDWKKKHLASIRSSLGGAPSFDQYYPKIESIYACDFERLIDLNCAFLEEICRWLSIRPTVLFASDLSPEGKSAKLILDLCKKTDAEHYYSAAGAQGYMSDSLGDFTAQGIEVEFQAWQHPEYRQRGDAFVSHLSVLDAVMNIGAAETRQLIESDSRGEKDGI